MTTAAQRDPRIMKNTFLKDVENHEMDVILDDGGVIRCIHFHPKDKVLGAYYFTLTTWPNHLCISGDMGTYVFSRELDMFAFFDDTRIKRKDGFFVNFDYWAEKIVSVSRFEGEVNIFNWKETIKELTEELNLSKEKAEELKDLEYPGNAHLAVHLLEETLDGCAYVPDHVVYSPSFHTQWCMNAILWGISEYKKHRVVQEKHDYGTIKASHTEIY